MVKFYDKNMNEVYLPKDTDLHYGSYPLELKISSIEYEKRGNKRVPTGRQASLRAFIISSRCSDMQMKIDRIFEFLRSLGEFYVASAHTPYKLLKVSVDQSYTIDYGNTVLTDFEIPLVVHKPYFKQSLHTTLDIDREGVRWNDKWAYGMGLTSEKERWKYSFNHSGGSGTFDFSFFNAGTEAIKLIQQKESVIRIKFNASGGFQRISDGDTEFRMDKSYVAGDVLEIKGHKVTLNGNNILGETNRNFLNVKKDWNHWRLTGAWQLELDIEFRFIYD